MDVDKKDVVCVVPLLLSRVSSSNIDKKRVVYEVPLPDDILEGYPLKAISDDDLPEGCFSFHNRHGLFAMINGYEEQAREILKDGGYPLTGQELEAMSERLPKQIRDILYMFVWFERVRREVEKNDAKMSAYFMAHAIHSAMKARIEPKVQKIKMGVAFTDTRAIVFKREVVGHKNIREALAKSLVAKYPKLTGSKVAAKITSKPMPFKHEGMDCVAYRIIRDDRSGKKNIYVCFETPEGSFNHAMDTFLNTLNTEIKNR
ncbi:MAG: hypothetical protein NTX36_12440 [Proteobacteria bacterium]|nr:hypothetical protein [Pseudomonadota bacterium]